MNPRFDRRSNNSSRSSRVGGRKKQEKDLSSRRRLGSEPSNYDRVPYRRRNDGIEEPLDRRENSKNFGNRGPRRRQETGYSKGNDKEAFDSTSLPRRFQDQRSSHRASDQRLRRRSYSEGKSQIRNNSERQSLPEGEVLTSSQPKDSSGQIISNDMIWGRHTVQSALESGRPIHRIWCTPELRSSQRFLRLLRDAKSLGVLVEEVTWARLGQITNGAVHQGIAIQTAAAETLDLQTLIEGCNKLGEPPLLLALDGLTDPQNLGAIVRSAEAFGAHGLVLPQRRSAGLTGSVAKVAAGALEHLPVARVVNLNRSLEDLKSAGYRVIGLAEEGNQTLTEVELDGPLVVVTGSEGKGISLVTRRHCDQLVRIPLRGATPSLNAATATAVFLYEVARNGWMKGLSGQSPSPRMVRAKCSSASIESKEELTLSSDQKSEAKADEKIIGHEIVSNSLTNDIDIKSGSITDEDYVSSPFNHNVQL